MTKEVLESTPDTRSDLLEHPPPGAWYKIKAGRQYVGATTRSLKSFLAFTPLVAAGSFVLFQLFEPQILAEVFHLRNTLIGIVIFLGILPLLAIALIALGGKTEVRIGSKSSVFIGLGPLGWAFPLDWRGVTEVRCTTASIDLEGEAPVSFATAVSQTHREYIAGVLLRIMESEGRPG